MEAQRPRFNVTLRVNRNRIGELIAAGELEDGSPAEVVLSFPTYRLEYVKSYRRLKRVGPKGRKLRRSPLLEVGVRETNGPLHVLYEVEEIHWDTTGTRPFLSRIPDALRRAPAGEAERPSRRVRVPPAPAGEEPANATTTQPDRGEPATAGATTTPTSEGGTES